MNRTLLLAHYRPAWLGARLECHGVVPSTNDLARRLLEELGPSAHGAVVVADGQSAGRGRHGRSWESPPGLSLALSVALWADEPVVGLPLLPLAGSLAALRALRAVTGIDAALKWPNDVMCGPRKIAGALLEARWSGDELAGLVLGVGLNLNQAEEDFQAGLRESATSVFIESGRATGAELFVAAILTELEPLLEASLAKPDHLVTECAPHWGHGAGDLLEASWDGGVHRGRFVEIAADGSLVLAEGDRKVRVTYGEVRSLRSGT